MGGMCNQERNRSPKRIVKRKKKALKQLEGLVSARGPLGIITYWFTKLCRPFRKHMQRTGRVPIKQVSCRRPILQDPIELVMDSPLRRPQDYQEGCKIGCSSSHQSHQFQTRLESTSNSGSDESRARGNLKRKIAQTMNNPNLEPDVKIHQCQASQSRQSRSEILTLRRECMSLRDANAALLKQVQVLQTEHTKEECRAEHFANQLRQVEAARDELISRLKNCRKSDYIASLEDHIQQKHDEISSLNEEVQSLNSIVAELVQTSYEHESPERPKSANREGYAQQNAISGSYVAESATPILLNNALSSAKGALKQFQKALTDAIRSKGDVASTVDLLQPDTYFARDSHVSYAAKAVVSGVLFEGFENESFNTCSGVSRFFDPDVRQAEFFKYFLREQEQNDTCDGGDPHFESFCDMKVPRLWEEFNLRKESNNQSKKVANLEALGGPKVVSSFRAAAKKVWLLHKLAFSFEPPASIFRVEQGAAVDTNYMDPVVSLEDSNRFVNEVGFMISPGFRLRKTVFRCEVYLSSTKFRTA